MVEYAATKGTLCKPTMTKLIFFCIDLLWTIGSYFFYLLFVLDNSILIKVRVLKTIVLS